MKAEQKIGRVVIDTNVLISAALSVSSKPAQITRLLIEHGELLFSAESFAELELRLWRPKFDRHVSPERRRLMLHDWAAIAHWVDLPPRPWQAYCRDPDDDVLLYTALVGQARCLITGDANLPEMPPVEGLQVITPAQAWAQWLPAGE